MWTDDLTTPNLFFTGKGGVGKTSLACASALASAESGIPTLIISTDPASNLDEVFGVALGAEPTPIPSVPNLWGANLDPSAAAAAYREKVVGPYRGKLPPAMIRNMEEQFSGACTTEIAAFDAFVQLLADDTVRTRFPRIVFDTAPTGHTLRLLSLPSAWTGYLNTTTAEASCLGPLAGLADQRAAYNTALRRLADRDVTTVVLVARPDRSSLAEAGRTQFELGELGVQNLRLVVNAVFESESDDPLASEVSRAAGEGISSMAPELLALKPFHLGLLPGNVVGLDALRLLLGIPVEAWGPSEQEALPPGQTFQALVAQLESAGPGVIMTMGKGGVGKTTIAARIALSIAESGKPVLLTTTDPAGNVLEMELEHPMLEVRRIDPVEEVKRYTEVALAKAAETMDEAGLALLREDLRSPCTEEIAVFRAFADAVAEGQERFVVIDTAPTGHTILLMDATEAYHREVARTQSDAPESVRALLPRLRDPEFTRVVLVTLPEPTPVHEAMSLSHDLTRAGIVPFGWVVNRSVAARQTDDPVLRSKAATEARVIAEVDRTGMPWALVPWSSQPLNVPLHVPV